MSDIEAMKNYVYQACADRPHQVDPRIFMVGVLSMRFVM